MSLNPTPSEPAVLSTREGAVCIISMNCPARMNVLSRELLGALHAELVKANEDSTVRAIILKGSGRSFSAGGDLAEFREDFAKAHEVAEQMVGRFHQCIRTMRGMPKPVIGALHGAIAGGGFSLAMACDLSVAADSATFLSAYTRLATNPDGGGTFTLTGLLGTRRAMEVMMLDNTIPAARALELGLVNRVVPAGTLEASAMDMARRLANGPATALGTAKRLVYAAQNATLHEQLDAEKASFISASRSDDFKEGVSAFFEKRAPRFGGMNSDAS